MTSQQAANLQSARQLAAAEIGISSADTVNIPYDQQSKFMLILAGIILQYPERFDQTTVDNARIQAGRGILPPLETFTVGNAVSVFSGEVVNQAEDIGAAVADVGAGVKTTLSLSKWLLPLAAVAALVILLVSLSKKTGAA